MTIVALVAQRYERAEEWRKENGMIYAEPQKQELNHCSMVKAINRHIEKSTNFRRAFFSSS